MYETRWLKTNSHLSMFVYSFDTEIRDSFHEHKCDPFFTGVDHKAEPPPLSPQFGMVEYTPVEYEAVEYEEVEYDPPHEILRDLRQLEDDITQGIQKLEEMVG